MGVTRIGRTGAVDLGLGTVGRTRIHEIIRKRTADFRVAPLELLGALCLLVIVFEQFHLLAFQAPELRAIIETAITLCGLAAACLFGLSFGHTRDLRNLVLAGALLELAVIDFASYVLPSAIDPGSPGSLTTAPVIGGLFVGTAMIVSASRGHDRQVGPGRRPLLVVVAVSLAAAGIAEIGGLLLRSGLSGGVDLDDHGLGASMQHPIGAALSVMTAALLVVAAVRTAGADRSSNGVALPLAAAMICFAGAGLNYLVLPTSASTGSPPANSYGSLGGG
jgi:hypothetical protein